MQLGMIGLGRMGANMVRRLIKGATNAWCSICRRKPSRSGEGEGNRSSLALRGFCHEAREAAGGLADGPGRGGGRDHR